MDPFILISAVVVAFVLFRLFSVLGTRTGHEQRTDIEQLQRGNREEQPAISEPEIDEAPAAPLSPEAASLARADTSFDEGEFLSGAKVAYEMVVEAFSSGDLKSVKDFLSAPVFDAFSSAVDQRSRAGHRADLKFVGIENARIIDSRVDNAALIATVEFTSNQVRVTRDADGNVIEGDPNRIDLVCDRWQFSRKRSSNDPNWALIATSAA